MVRWSWVNFQCRGVLLVWIRVGQGPTALAVGAGGGCLDIFTLIYPFSQRVVKPKNNQPTNISVYSARWSRFNFILLDLGSGGAMVLCNLPVPGRPTI